MAWYTHCFTVCTDPRAVLPAVGFLDQLGHSLVILRPCPLPSVGICQLPSHQLCVERFVPDKVINIEGSSKGNLINTRVPKVYAEQLDLHCSKMKKKDDISVPGGRAVKTKWLWILVIMHKSLPLTGKDPADPETEIRNRLSLEVAGLQGQRMVPPPERETRQPFRPRT